MNRSHALSEKAIKEMGLDKKREENPLSKEVVKEWASEQEYWAEWEAELEDRHATWSTKIKNFFVYRIGRRTRDWWRNMKWYFHNLKTFQPILKTWRSFDYHYQVDLFKFGIEQLIKAKEYYGNERSEDAQKRIGAMRALIEEIDRDYDEEVRERLNYDYRKGGRVTEYADGSICFHNDDEEHEKETDKLFEEIAKERKLHYQKIFDLIIGQDREDIKKEMERRIAAMPEEEKQAMSKGELNRKVYMEVWDGSGIEGWYD